MSEITRYAFINIQNGEIEGIVDTPDPSSYTPGGTTVDGLYTVPVPVDIAPSIAITNWFYVYTGDLLTSYFAERPVQPGPYYYWENAEWTLDSTQLFEELRALRNGYLTRSDWTQLADAPLTPAEIAEAQTYRQSLRDLPQAMTGITHLDQVTWPTPPSFLT